jgi:hypothetical protein
VMLSAVPGTHFDDEVILYMHAVNRST